MPNDGGFVELTDRQRRIIDAKHEYENNGGSIRSIALAHQISFSALQRAVKQMPSFSIVAASKGRGRKAKTQVWMRRSLLADEY